MRIHRFVLVSLFVVVFVLNSRAQWVQTNGPYGGVVVDFATHGDTLLGAGNLGVFRTTDRGVTWLDGAPLKRNADGTPYASATITSIFTQGVNLYASSHYGMFQSVDDGVTWKNVSTGLPIADIGAFPNLYSVCKIGERLLAGGADSVYLSTDNALHWSGIPKAPKYASPLFQYGVTLLCTGESGVYRSSDSGKSWSPSSTGLYSYGAKDFAASKNYLFAATGGGVFRSADTGASWVPVNSGLTFFGTHALLVSGNDLFAGTNGGGVYRSTDLGAHWRAVNTGLVDLNIWAIAQVGQDIYVATANSGVWRGAISDFQNASVNSDDVARHFVSPNPASNMVTVSGTAHATITNMLGVRVIEATNHNESDLTLDVSNLPAGTYFVRSNGSSSLQKLIKE
jgi:photosystem II stability/assembly factor-like uncharacterized protein